MLAREMVIADSLMHWSMLSPDALAARRSGLEQDASRQRFARPGVFAPVLVSDADTRQSNIDLLVESADATAC